MRKRIVISGFADEISSGFAEQLETVTSLGMDHISLRSADGKGIADYTAEEAKEKLLPVLQQYGVGVSSIGSPIGKVGIEDEEGFARQKKQLVELCRMCRFFGTRYIRVFSFFIPEGRNADDYREAVMDKLQQFVDIAKEYDVILIHENEKDIYGDIGRRCLDILQTIDDPHLVSAFDFANYVQCGEDPLACWEMTAPYNKYIHVKDAVTTDKENVLAGTGEGRLKEILDLAINRQGYEGFLTLEPHLVIFASLKSLETKDTKDIIKENKYESGAEAYAAQYHALLGILAQIGA